MLLLGVWSQRQPLADVLAIALGDEEQSHIILVPFIAMWLAYLRRSRLRFIRVRPSLIGPLAVLTGSLVSWLGFNSGTQIAWHGGAGLVLIGIVLSLTSFRLVREFAPVFVVLMFALPVPGVIRQAIALPLQAQATIVTQSVLELLGVACTRLGNVLMINGQQVAVGEACNGMRMIFAFVLVAYAFGFCIPLRTSTRVALLTFSPVIALLCNIIRLVPTSLIYGYGSAGIAETFHDITGWVMLPVALMILIAVLRLCRWLEFPLTSYRLAIQ